jgi:Ran GTPase-activating protein (RanGAP) involved in mRNA processing and transport
LECEEVLRRGSLDLRGEERRFGVLGMSSHLSYGIRPSEGVAEAVRNNAALSMLDINGDWFGDDDAEALGHALAGNTSLKSLDLWQCSFGARGLKSIAEALKFSNTINDIHLDIMKNIGDAGAEIMADLFSSTSSLEWLTLFGCGIGAPGSTSIAKALKVNTSLKRLCMSHNERIGDAGAAALADALTTTTSLTRLWLDGCRIGEQGGLALGRALGANLALPLDFEFTYGDDIPGAKEEAARVRALVLLRREKLLAFGMAMLKRLGGGPSAEEASTSPSRERSTFHYMCKDVFRLVGDAYVD